MRSFAKRRAGTLPSAELSLTGTAVQVQQVTVQTDYFPSEYSSSGEGDTPNAIAAVRTSKGQRQ